MWQATMGSCYDTWGILSEPLSITCLALANQYYLCANLFIVGTLVALHWYFGELCCQMLLSLNLHTITVPSNVW